MTPFGLLNDEAGKVEFFLDQDFAAPEALIGVHPNDNRATVFLKAADLVAFLKAQGKSVTFAAF